MINRTFLLPALLFAALRTATGQATPPALSVSELDPPREAPKVFPNPVVIPEEAKPEGVAWKSLLVQSLGFLGIEHGFRYMTEAATRDPGRPFFGGYVDSITNLHGWADGDPFYVNYVGHPMQGAVAGFIWTQNDRRYRFVEFGRNPGYWKSRLRAFAFSWVYSTQMEIGPLSEATIGNIQASLPQQGFVDHVITPTIGLGWQITEDALDRYLVRYLERKTSNRYYRALFRGGLNPSRSLANVIGGKTPWARPRDEMQNFGDAGIHGDPSQSHPKEVQPGVAPMELALNSYFLPGTSPCVGGGSTVAFRIHPQWQIIGDVSGCKVMGLTTNLSGDSLTYAGGFRWTPMLSERWHPYLQLLGGGNKVAQEQMFPDEKAALERTLHKEPDPGQYTHQTDTAGPALVAGAGVDLRLNSAFRVRLFSVDYTRAWVRDLPGFPAPNGLQVKAGLVLQFGTW